MELLHFRTPLLLLMTHHEETWLNGNHSPNTNPNEGGAGTKVQERRKNNVEFSGVFVFGLGTSEGSNTFL